MTQFWIAALALGLVAAAVVLVPAINAWAKEGTDRSSSTLGVGILVALAIPVISIMLYSNWSTWDWGSGGTQQRAQGGGAEHAEMDQAIVALEQRLAEQPEDMESWVLLGRSYMSRRRFDDAADAFRNAVALDTNEAPQLLADYGEALALSDPEGLQGEAGVVIERVLALNPQNAKGLWYGGLNAFDNARWDLAIERLSKLLTLNPPETLIPLIEERIESARTHADGGMPETAMQDEEGPATDAPPAASEAASEPAEPPATVAEEIPAMDPSEGIQVEVTLDADLARGLANPAPLFIFARPPGGGPPLAAIRAGTEELPMSLVLTDDNAMMQGVTILDQPELELVARVSLGGTPAQRPGDLYGTVEYVREEGGPVRIVIDRVAE